MTEPPREPGEVLREAVSVLALQATRLLYEEQPALWELGEHGRARTLEDFGHHFAALSLLDGAVFDAHVAYCTRLFTARGFPLRWLDDAWRVMLEVVRRELPPAVADDAVRILTGYVIRSAPAR